MARKIKLSGIAMWVLIVSGILSFADALGIDVLTPIGFSPVEGIGAWVVGISAVIILLVKTKLVGNTM